MTQNLHVFIDSPGDVGHERDALPGATVGPANDAAYIVTERPSLSHCVESSVRRLSNALPGQLLSAADVLADIAKNGTGSSITLLGKHKIGPLGMDRILARKGIQVLGT